MIRVRTLALSSMLACGCAGSPKPVAPAPPPSPARAPADTLATRDVRREPSAADRAFGKLRLVPVHSGKSAKRACREQAGAARAASCPDGS